MMRRATTAVAVALVAAAGACRGSRPAPPVPAAAPSPVVYFAMTDRFADGDTKNDRDVDRAAPGAYHGGDFAGLRARLDYLDDLGVDILWISPIVDNIDGPVHGAGFADWGYHGYWAADFTRIDEHLGGERALRALVDDAHRRGLRVILDVVLNHAGYDAPAAADEKQTRSPARGDCGRDPLTQCLYGLPDFRSEDPAVARTLIDGHIRWLERSGADGFRCDSALHVELDVWRSFAERARAARPGAWLAGEVWGAAPGAGAQEDRPGDDVYLNVFDAIFDFAFADRALAFATGAEDAAALARHLEARGAADRYLVSLNTHDTTGFLHRAGGDTSALLVGAALQLTVPGIPLIYYGDETARPGGDWPLNRGDMIFPPDPSADTAVHARYRALIRARRDARLTGPYRTLVTDGRIIAFARGDTFVVVNGGASTGVVTLPGPPRRDLLGAAVTAPAPDGFDVTLPARAAAIFPAE